MGISKRHARSVPLVLNFDTGNITAQWNVVFDNWFSTVATNVDDMPDFHAEEWANMFRTSIYDGDDDEELHEVVKQPAIRNDREIEDDGMEEEELLRQPMLQPNPLIQPNQTTPDRTYSQVTTTNYRTPDRESTRQLSPQKRPSPTQSEESTEIKHMYTPPTPNPPSIQPMNKLTPR